MQRLCAQECVQYTANSQVCSLPAWVIFNLGVSVYIYIYVCVCVQHARTIKTSSWWNTLPQELWFYFYCRVFSWDPMMTGDGKKFGMWHGNQLFTRNTADMFLCSWSAVMLVNCFAKEVDWIKLSLAVLFSTRSPRFSAQKRHTQESDELLSLWKIAIIRPDVSSRSAGRKKALEAPQDFKFLGHKMMQN